jgi:hypothetical protein
MQPCSDDNAATIDEATMHSSSTSPVEPEEDELEADAQAWIRGDPKRQVNTSILQAFLLNTKPEYLSSCSMAAISLHVPDIVDFFA